MVKGRRGHSKSFTNISQSFIIFALPTAGHKSTSSRSVPALVLRAVWGSPQFTAPRAQDWDGFQGQRDTQAWVGILDP